MVLIIILLVNVLDILVGIVVAVDHELPELSLGSEHLHQWGEGMVGDRPG